jgi:hypothetical protein
MHDAYDEQRPADPNQQFNKRKVILSYASGQRHPVGRSIPGKGGEDCERQCNLTPVSANVFAKDMDDLIHRHVLF